MTENSVRVFQYLKAHYGEKVTAQDVAAALGVSLSAVTGSVNGLASTKKHPAYAVRTEAEVPAEDGKTAKVKYVSLTEEGMAFDPDKAE